MQNNFDFQIFQLTAKKAYKKVDQSTYSIDDVLSVFRYYFERFEKTFHQPHPHLSVDQIIRIIRKMPFIDKDSDVIVDILPDDYLVLIDQHFRTQYEHCDYNINHFFSGDIRANRFYETLY